MIAFVSGCVALLMAVDVVVQIQFRQNRMIRPFSVVNLAVHG